MLLHFWDYFISLLKFISAYCYWVAYQAVLDAIAAPIEIWVVTISAKYVQRM